jgi:hypothetical protein
VGIRAAPLVPSRSRVLMMGRRRASTALREPAATTSSQALPAPGKKKEVELETAVGRRLYGKMSSAPRPRAVRRTISKPAAACGSRAIPAPGVVGAPVGRAPTREVVDVNSPPSPSPSTPSDRPRGRAPAVARRIAADLASFRSPMARELRARGVKGVIGDFQALEGRHRKAACYAVSARLVAGIWSATFPPSGVHRVCCRCMTRWGAACWRARRRCREGRRFAMSQPSMLGREYNAPGSR